MDNDEVRAIAPDGEVWRPVVGFPGYEVSSEGRIRSFLYGYPRIIRASSDRYGYLRVRLYCDGRRFSLKVHRLVCEAWHGPPTAEQCAHEDGDKQNNRPENLRWASRSENAFDSMRHGVLKIPPRPTVIWSGGKRECTKPTNAVLTEEQVSEIRKRRQQGEEGKMLAREFGVHPSTVSRISKRRSWSFV